MGELTTIQIPRRTRERLRGYGGKGETYAEILERLMKRVDYEEFMEEHYRRMKDRKDLVPLDEI